MEGHKPVHFTWTLMLRQCTCQPATTAATAFKVNSRCRLTHCKRCPHDPGSSSLCHPLWEPAACWRRPSHLQASSAAPTSAVTALCELAHKTIRLKEGLTHTACPHTVKAWRQGRSANIRLPCPDQQWRGGSALTAGRSGWGGSRRRPTEGGEEPEVDQGVGGCAQQQAVVGGVEARLPDPVRVPAQLRQRTPLAQRPVHASHTRRTLAKRCSC